jgi:cellulose synthase operon protein C
MPLPSRSLLCALLLSSALALSGCQSDEEQAEEFYQSGLALLEAGDEERALVEFRNVFQYDGFHKDARQTYADLQLKRGEVAEAYSQYLRLIEQYPDTPEVRQTLAELAIQRNDWEEAERHGRAAIQLAPDVPGVKAIALALNYRTAVLDRDEGARIDIADQAAVLLETAPDNLVARRIVIDRLMAGPTPQDAIPEIEKILALTPNAFEFHILKVGLLAQINDVEGTGAQLKQMYALFPENEEVRQGLIGWYLVKGDIDGAEAFLRELAGDLAGPTEGHIAVVQLLQTARGSDAAATELDRLIAANADQPNGDLYRALRAGVDFDAGRKSEAITAIEAILKTATPSDQTRDIKGMLAQMLIATGNQVGARARVEEILAEDLSNVDALKLRAAWLITDDKPREAIIDLRAALDQNPRDVDTLMLMAEAHERDGNADLAGESLASAVEISDAAPEPARRYAGLLLRQGREQPAEAVLIDARTNNPADLGVAAQLADIWLRRGDWARLQRMAREIRSLDTPEAIKIADSLDTTVLLGQNRTDEGLTFLREQAGQDGSAQAIARVIETLLRTQKSDEARIYLDQELAKAPDDPALRLLDASLDMVTGQTERAETLLRNLVAADPAAEAPVRLLYGLLVASDRGDEALALLDTALAAQPTSGMLRWMKAGALERRGDIDGAIVIYEALYVEDSSNMVMANNLASLITTHKSDAASLDRAFAIARRLRGLDVPAFQDTYGWIAYRRGELAEALAHLEPAAAGLPDDPFVQFHLGMTYAGLNRSDDAIRQLGRALELAGDGPAPGFTETARKTIADLQAEIPDTTPETPPPESP